MKGRSYLSVEDAFSFSAKRFGMISGWMDWNF